MWSAASSILSQHRDAPHLFCGSVLFWPWSVILPCVPLLLELKLVLIGFIDLFLSSLPPQLQD